MKKYRVSYGLGGGIGSTTEDDEIYEFENDKEAMEFAWEKACEEYEDYVGLYGLRTLHEIMEEDGIESVEEATGIYKEERENWIEYSITSIE